MAKKHTTQYNFQELREQVMAVAHQAVDTALTVSAERYVKPLVQEVMFTQLNKEVYGVYTPKYYRRRESEGGLADFNNMRIEFVKTDPNHAKVVIENVAPMAHKHTSNVPTALADMVNDGLDQAKQNPDAPIYQRPRPFMDKTIEELEAGVLQTTFRDGFNATMNTILKGMIK